MNINTAFGKLLFGKLTSTSKPNSKHNSKSTSETVQRSNPELWERIKKKFLKGDKGGKPGQWSARKAQLAVQEYKRRGGTYIGKRSKKNALTKWTQEEWGTRSGKNSIQGPNATGERYLPKKAREALSKSEYTKTTRKKREAIRNKKQYSKQPKTIAKKTRKYRN